MFRQSVSCLGHCTMLFADNKVATLFQISKECIRNKWNTERGFQKKTGIKPQNNNREFGCTKDNTHIALYQSTFTFVAVLSRPMLLFFKWTFLQRKFLAFGCYYQQQRRPWQSVIHLDFCVYPRTEKRNKEKKLMKRQVQLVDWMNTEARFSQR